LKRGHNKRRLWSSKGGEWVCPRYVVGRKGEVRVREKKNRVYSEGPILFL